ncbi:MAG: thioredoxin family protein [Syntrophorhabdaceae bacterium]
MKNKLLITGHIPYFFMIALSISFLLMTFSACNSGSVPEKTKSKPTASPAAAQYPALVDVGAKQCIPCKMMAPILDELAAEYAGRLRVEFIDVQIDPETATKLGVRGIPTQIFYDSSGKERHRHLGYISKEDILATFKKLNIDLAKKDPGKKVK